MDMPWMCSCTKALSRATLVRTSWKLLRMLFLKMLVAHSSTGIGSRLSSASFQFTTNITTTTTTSFNTSPMMASSPCEKMFSMVSMSLIARVTSVPMGVRSK